MPERRSAEVHYAHFGIIEDADKCEALACKAEQDEDERARRLLAQQLAE